MVILAGADVLIGGKRWNGALNRLYYAAFCAARALLATQNLDSSRHSGVISLFQEHFVRTGSVLQETARVLPRLFEKRQTTDYGDYAEATHDEVASLRVQVEGFLKACENLLRANPNCGPTLRQITGQQEFIVSESSI